MESEAGQAIILMCIILQVYVWHTQTKVPLMTWEIALIKNGTPSNPLIEA